MLFQIRGENIQITDAIREYTIKKIEKTEKLIHDSSSIVAHVNIKIYQDKKSKIEVTIPLKHFVLRAEEVHDDLYAAIDIISDKLERQVRKHKTKVNSKYRERELKDVFFATNQTEEYDTNSEIEIVRNKQLELKPMDSEEAVLQMNLLGHAFFVFINSETNQTNVVYRRKDGKYGLIEAK